MAAVKLSHRYLPDRQLPDKAVSVLDTACARLALGQNAIPPAIEDATRARRSGGADARPGARSRHSASDHAEAPGAIAEAARARPKRDLQELKARLEKEEDLVTEIREIRAQAGTARCATAAAAAEAAAPRAAAGARPRAAARRSLPSSTPSWTRCRAKRP